MRAKDGGRWIDGTGEAWYPGDLVDLRAFPQNRQPTRTSTRTSLDTVDNNARSPLAASNASECFAALYVGVRDESRCIWPDTADALTHHLAWLVARRCVPECSPDTARKYCSRHGIDRPPQGRAPQDAAPLTVAYAECLGLRALLRSSETPVPMHGAVAWHAATLIHPVPRQYQPYACPTDDVVLMAKALVSAIGAHANAPDPSLVLPLVAARRSGLALYDAAWIARVGRHLDPAGKYVSLQGIPGDCVEDLNALAERMCSQVGHQLAVVWQGREAEAAQKAARAQARRSRREPDPWRAAREAERAMPISFRMRPVFPPRGA